MIRYIIAAALVAVLALGFAEKVEPAMAQQTAVDSDFDGCTDAEELGSNPRLGGRRDPRNAFDFFDVNGDRVVNSVDVNAVRAHIGATKGSPGYDLGYDRAIVGPNRWNLGPGNGVVDLSDVMAVRYQLGHRCQGRPAPDLQAMCSSLEAQARSEGFREFTCSTRPFSNPAFTGEEVRRRDVRLNLRPDNSVMVAGRDLEVRAISGTPPTGVQIASFHPSYCNYQVCQVTLTYRTTLEHFWGAGPNCAWFKFQQKYKVYAPWAAIFEVRNPVVTSGASFPCSEDDRESWIDRTGEPFWAESGGRIKWVAGIPTPWGTIGLRTFHPSVAVWFDGLYHTDWTY